LSGEVVIVFRSRLNENARAEYEPVAQRMVELAKQQPGFQSIKYFEAEDGERVTIAEFESLEHAMAWRAHPEHAKAQRQGRESFYDAFEVVTCEVVRRIPFTREQQ